MGGLMSTALAAQFAVTSIALYAGHHVGDYWVQTDDQALLKGTAGWRGRLACLAHVLSYLATQAALVLVADWVLGLPWRGGGMILALAVSGVTHYLADRREYGIMFKLARLLPGKDNFLKLGVPRSGARYLQDPESINEPAHYSYDDNPSLGTGAWALDQAWHIFWGVFVAALVSTI